MKENSKSATSTSLTKLHDLSPTSVAITFAALFCFHENSQMLFSAIGKILMLQSPDDSLTQLEESFKKHINSAAQLTCLLPLAQKLLTNTKSCEGPVAFFYILFRLVHQHTAKTQLTRKESIDLWAKIWDFISPFPIIQREWVKMEERNDLENWKRELQEHARSKWQYFITQQKPKYENQVTSLSIDIQNFFNSTTADK